MTFEHPWALLLLLAIPLVPGPRGLARWVWGLCVAGVVIGLAAPTVGHRAKPRVVLAVDVSESLPAVYVQALVSRLLPALQPTGLMAFARGPEVLETETRLLEVAGRGLPGPTNVGRGLEAAWSLIPDGGQVILLTDGRSMDDPVQVAEAMARSGVRVHVVPGWPERAPNVSLLRVEAPDTIPPGARVPVRIVLSCLGPVDLAGTTIELSVDRETARALPLPGDTRCDGEPTTILAYLTLQGRGNKVIRAKRTGTAEDLVPEDDQAATVVTMLARPRVLWVGDGPPSAIGLRAEPVAPSDLGSRPLGGYDMVVLDDVPEQALRAGAVQALEGFVRGGGGLLVLGGEHSFAAGDYSGTRLDELLPVSSNLRRKGGRMAVILLIDKSGSMGGYESGWERLLLAKETLRSLLETMGRPDDEVGVLSFDTGPRVVMPLTRVSDLDIEGLDTGSIQAGGGTDPGPAIEQARLELEFSRAQVKQIVAITDGRFAGEGLEERIRALPLRGIHFSAVAVGSAARIDRLEHLATLGKGHVSMVRHARFLPRAVTREILRASMDPIRRGPVPVVPGTKLAKLHPDLPLPFPDLDALDVTIPRERAARWIQTASGEPVLTAWSLGSGVVTCFTASPHAWATGWRGWAGWSPLWSAVVARTTRRPSLPWELTVRRVGDHLIVAMETTSREGVPMTRLHPEAMVVDPGGRPHVFPMQEVRPGVYRGRHDTRGLLGRYQITITTHGETVAQAQTVLTTPAELLELGNDMATLREIAAATKGELLDPDSPSLPRPSSPRKHRAPVRWPWALAGLLCLLAYLWVGAIEHGRPARRSPRTGTSPGEE